MKPLPVTPLTPEDFAISCCWPRDVALNVELTEIANTVGRRDAALMLGVKQGRNLRIDHPGDPAGDFTGWLFDVPAIGAFDWPHFTGELE